MQETIIEIRATEIPSVIETIAELQAEKQDLIDSVRIGAAAASAATDFLMKLAEEAPMTVGLFYMKQFTDAVNQQIRFQQQLEALAASYPNSGYPGTPSFNPAQWWRSEEGEDPFVSDLRVAAQELGIDIDVRCDGACHPEQGCGC